MSISVIQYRVHEDAREENARLVEAIFSELHALSPKGFDYKVLSLEDGRFMHLVSRDPQSTFDMAQLAAFERFRRGLSVRAQESPVRTEAVVVGTYGSWLDQAPTPHQGS